MTSIAPRNTPHVFKDSSPLDSAIKTLDNPSPSPTMASHGVLAEARPHGPPLPHVDDITANPRDIDSNQSIKRLLEVAEMALRSAETSRDFKRPGTALREYIKAYFICVVTVKNHRDYPTLHSSWGELAKKHSSLLKKIDVLHPTYEQIKADIKADNLRTGALPNGSKVTASSHTSEARGPSTEHIESNVAKLKQNRQSQPPLNFTGKAKPVVQPKPEALHGNALTNGHVRSSTSVDLSRDMIALRLAALRGPQSSPGQDPRIKTHPIVPPKPAGPRSMPPSGKPKIGVDSSVPSLPRMPDAIYSPVRGTVSDEAAKLPTSTPRGLFSRTGSSTSITSSLNTPTQQSFGDSFPSPKSVTTAKFPDQRSIDSASATSSPKPSLDISPGETITAERLYELMKARVSILIVDVRPRVEFDDGHIMSTSTICIEPDILTRENLSCDQISESLILSPNQEQAIFDKRNEYDLVVIYDKDTEVISRPPRTPSDSALVSVFRALVHLNYGRDLRQPPRLLAGGIDAWVDLLGPSALQSTSSSSAKTARLRVMTGGGSLGRTKSKYVGKPMRPDEARAWQETVNQDDEMTASTPSFHRTTEDFMRRFPAVSLEQESMTSPIGQPTQLSGPSQGPSGPSRWHGDAPNPPTRPDPAVQRPSYNGLSQGPGQNGDSDVALAPGRGNSALDGQRSPVERHLTTLNNPGSWCYANSVLQALFASQFSKEIRGQAWKNIFKVPMKQDEKIPQPQLMMQILANLFHWMSTGNFKTMKAHTLMNYSQHVTKQMRHAQVFGTHQQHDAQEFLQFLMEQMDDETNRNRDKDGFPKTPAVPQGRPFNQLSDIADGWWNEYSNLHSSIIDDHFRFIRATNRRCPECDDQTWDWASEAYLACPLGARVDSLPKALDDLTSDKMPFTCDKCKKQAEQRHITHYYRLPSTLCFTLQRHDSNLGRRIVFELDNFDMSRWGTAPAGASNMYECFAIIKHVGSDMTAGHYTCFVRAPGSSSPNSWILFNDSAKPKVLYTKDIVNGQESIFEGAYILLYRRKDAARAGL